MGSPWSLVSPRWWLCIYANMGINRVENSFGPCVFFILSLCSFLLCITTYLACWAHETSTASFYSSVSHLSTFNLFTLLHVIFCSHCQTSSMLYKNPKPSLLPNIMCQNLTLKLTKRAQSDACCKFDMVEKAFFFPQKTKQPNKKNQKSSH